MSDYFLSGETRTGQRLVIAPITAEIAAAHDMDRSESVGYFLYQKSADSGSEGVNILARLPSEDAAFELGRILGLT